MVSSLIQRFFQGRSEPRSGTCFGPVGVQDHRRSRRCFRPHESSREPRLWKHTLCCTISATVCAYPFLYPCSFPFLSFFLFVCVLKKLLHKQPVLFVSSLRSLSKNRLMFCSWLRTIYHMCFVDNTWF